MPNFTLKYCKETTCRIVTLLLLSNICMIDGIFDHLITDHYIELKHLVEWFVVDFILHIAL